jgi:hypothetical protein
MWQQVVENADVLCIDVRECLKEIGQILKRVPSIFFCGFDNAVDRRTGRGNQQAFKRALRHFPVSRMKPPPVRIRCFGIVLALAVGRTSVTDNRGTTSIAYEAVSDRVTSVTDPVTGTISYTLINDN